MQESPRQRAQRYWVDDQPGADSPGTRLANILQLFTAGRPLSEATETFLASRGLNALVAYAKGEIGEGAFAQAAQAEQRLRCEHAERERVHKERERVEAQAREEARQQAMWAEIEVERLRRESDPRHIARRKNREQREKYGIHGYVEQEHFPRLMAILRCLENRGRVAETEMVWLAAEGRDYRTEEILHAYHRIEADALLAEYRSTGDIWKAVTASGHLRKCRAAQEAQELLSIIPEQRLSSPKLKSALQTTHGGTLRDLNRHEEAVRLGEEAHALQPNDFRPCTLLGAIHMERQEFAQGHEWYRKAEERGAPPNHVDSEIRAILARMSQEARIAAIESLLESDSFRYDWLKKAFSGGHGVRQRQGRRDHGK